MARSPFSPLLALWALSLPRALPAATLDDCRARFAAAPESRQSADCFSDVAANQGTAGEAARQVEALLDRYPRSPWLLMSLGRLRWSEPVRAEGPFRSAAAAFAARGDAKGAEGEILARTALHLVLVSLGRPAAAAAEVARVEAIASRTGDPLLIARSQVLAARHLRLQGQDLERAYLLLHHAVEAAFPRGSFGLQRDALEELASVCHSLGRQAEERDAYHRLAGLAAAAGERRTEAIAHYGALRGLVEELFEMPCPEGRREVAELAGEVLAAASAVGYTELTGRAHLVLGRLASGAAAQAHLEQCLAGLAPAQDRSLCLLALAEQQRRSGDLPAAQRTVQEALALASQAQDPWSRAYAWRERMRVSWEALPRDRALADARSALGIMESIRDHQRGEASRAGLSALWSQDYYWLSGRLLASGDAASRDEAFGVMERLRARTLVEALEAARAAPRSTPSPLLDSDAAALEEIARVQRRLLDPALSAADRAVALRRLRELELAETEVRNQIAAAGPALADLRQPGFAVLPQVRQALAADEALLSFQIAPDETLFGDFGGGSWLLVSTRGGTRAIRLRRDRVALRPAVALWNGLFERRDGAEARPAPSLYHDLLADGLAGLPPAVRRLVIVPDDALHLFPFAALCAAAGDPPLALRYEISVVPSATLWLRWRSQRPPAAAEPLLALADPVVPGGGAGDEGGREAGGQGAGERIALFAGGIRLGALPFARREGETAVRHLDGGSVLRVGGEASEGFVKQADLSRFGILHFATHAVLDDQHPERSGVLLTPAPASEDGLLQLREIVRLRLDGRVVVLSSCRSASGQMVRGEGVMGLARAFFEAGAHTVVASLWPLRDDDGAALFDRFYAHLARGRSVAAALGAAQRDRIAAGAPAYAWAGLVVLGDGDLVPLPGGRKGFDRALPGFPGWAWAGGVGVILLLVILGGLAARRARTPSR